CLPGTRTEELKAIMSWASGGTPLPDPLSYLQALTPDCQALWLCGVAGSGKSSIALSVAQNLHAAGVLVGFYGFSAANQAALHPSKMFTTLALQLATQDQSLGDKLLSIIEGVDVRTRTSLSPPKQLDTFLLPLLQPAEDSPPVHQIVIVIDALDEAGAVSQRAEILSLLVELDTRLPANVKMLITSR
ncbi:hypothetical protein DL93DRAFT_2034818, partial [Clavulina sp. PMI_390]